MLSANKVSGHLLTRFYLLGRDLGMEKSMEKEDLEICSACKELIQKGESFYPITAPGNKTVYVHERCMRKGAPPVAGKGDAPMVK